MTEQAGHLNAPDLVEECARALAIMRIREARRWDTPAETLEEMIANGDSVNYVWPDFVGNVEAVLSVLRKRGLLTIQALELLGDK